MRSKLKVVLIILSLLVCSACHTVKPSSSGTGSQPETQNATQSTTKKREESEMKRLSTGSQGLKVTVEIGYGIILESVCDEMLEHEYIIIPSALFDYTVDGQVYSSADNIEILSAEENDGRIDIRAKSRERPLGFALTLQPDLGSAAVLMDFSITNNGKKHEYIVINYPKLLTVKAPGDTSDTYASVPQEIGWVGKYDAASTMGFLPNPAVGLPTGQNVMEVVSVYNRKNLGGLFVADINGDIATGTPPVNMTLDKTVIEGHSVAQLGPGESKETATIAIGLIRDNDWHAAVDYYVEKHRPNWLFPDVPDWLRDAGAVYSAKNAGAGGCYMLLPERTDLRGRIGNFVSLSILLREAQDMGTNVVFVSDYYDRADISGERIDPPSLTGAVGSHYWNKGDYIPRADLGGPDAFKRGIKSLHDAGGKIIVYVEPYIALYFSNIGREKGEQWAARHPDGSLDMSYPYNYTMCSALPEWREHIRNICVNLVEEYDVDGIFLDSMGWQWNHNYMTLADNRVYSLKEYNDGFLAMTVEVREAIRKVKPDAVVLSETGGGPLSRYNDGGWTADFAWGKTVSNPKILSSPLRYAIPEANIYSNGDTLSHLRQVYAAGHGLALSYHWEDHKDYIKRLVELRIKYKDAIIYGKQDYQPSTVNQFVAAYSFTGATNTVVTVINTLGLTYKGKIGLKPEYGDSKWVDELTGNQYTADDMGRLTIELPPQELMVICRIS